MTTLQLNGINISMLNDDCIYAILEWLSLDDLCLFSRTCKRFQSLCGNHFRRKYPNKVSNIVRVEIGRNGKLRIENYVKYFYKFITNLYIEANETKLNQEVLLTTLINFIKTKCDDNLYRITIVGDVKLVRLGKETQNILKNVELVEFTQRSAKAGHQDEATFLKYCPKLSQLLCGIIDGSSVDAILQQYSQLTHLKKLYLTVNTSVGNSFHAICSHLNLLNEHGIFTYLEMDFVLHKGAQLLSLHVKQLSNLKQLTKIHFKFIELDSVMPALRLLIHLKVIGLRYLILKNKWISWTHLDELIGKVDSVENMHLPQVEEVQLDYMFSDKEVYACIMLFARHWMNLKRMLVPDVKTGQNIKFHIPELNRAREKLTDACELTIFTNHKGNATSLNHELVKLKFVKLECNRDADPFQKYYIEQSQ